MSTIKSWEKNVEKKINPTGPPIKPPLAQHKKEKYEGVLQRV